jgi:hypothetical protein
MDGSDRGRVVLQIREGSGGVAARSVEDHWSLLASAQLGDHLPQRRVADRDDQNVVVCGRHLRCDQGLSRQLLHQRFGGGPRAPGNTAEGGAPGHGPVGEAPTDVAGADQR